MCQYSCTEGLANSWHAVHLGQFAIGGASIVFTEAAAVTEGGRISPNDLGIWNDAQAEALAPIAGFIREQGAAPGVQLAHAGRKASTARPWEGGGPLSPEQGGWSDIVAPSALPFAPGHAEPRAASDGDIAAVRAGFVSAARRALEAGFEVVEIHAAHGYLLNEFLSPLSNRRTDQYGGSLENRTRLLREVIADVRTVWPERLPLFVRISTTDWTEGGWDVEQSVELSGQMEALGVDLIDCSSGGNVADAKIPVGAGYQTAAAARIRREARIPVGAVGMITQPAQADTIIRTEQADLVLLAREMLRDPHWPQRAASALHQPAPVPVQYGRAWG